MASSNENLTAIAILAREAARQALRRLECEGLKRETEAAIDGKQEEPTTNKREKGNRVPHEGWQLSAKFEEACNEWLAECLEDFIDNCDLELTDYDEDGNTVCDDLQVSVYARTEDYHLFHDALPNMLRGYAKRCVCDYHGVKRPLSEAQANDMRSQAHRFRRLAELASELAEDIEAKI